MIPQWEKVKNDYYDTGSSTSTFLNSLNFPCQRDAVWLCAQKQ